VAQQLIRDFVADLTRTVSLRDPVVEFGSLQVEPAQPNDLRPLFEGHEYMGTDMRAGPGVDRVEDLRSLSFADGELGTALCLDTLEHCEDPLTACRELHRVLDEDGVCVVSSVMLFGIHGYPNDFWRFTPEGLRTLLAPFDDVWVAGIGDPDIPFQVVGVGAQGRSLDLSLESFPSLLAAQRDWDAASGKVRIGPFRMSLRELGRTLAAELPRALRQRAGTRLAGKRG
jgi:SAM-dependent methyltransferase